MAKKDKTYGGCESPEFHSDHMCVLMEKGRTEAIRRRSLHPVRVCGNCKAQADKAEDLCNPQPL